MGVCQSKFELLWYKLVGLSTLSGILVAYELVPANLDERLAAEAVMDYLSSCDIFADKGCLGYEWQISIFDQTNNRIWTTKRKNQYVQNSKALDRWLSSLQERIEGVFHEVQNTGRNLERLLAKTILGLCIDYLTE